MACESEKGGDGGTFYSWRLNTLPTPGAAPPNISWPTASGRALAFPKLKVPVGRCKALGQGFPFNAIHRRCSRTARL